MLGQGMIFVKKTAQALCGRIWWVINKLDIAPMLSRPDLIRKEAAERRRAKPIAYTNSQVTVGIKSSTLSWKLFYFAAH